MEKETPLKTNGISKVFNQQTNNDVFNEGIPLKFKKSIHPVLVVNPLPNNFCDIVANNSATSTGATTIYTTPTDKDFYLTEFSVSVIKDATCDSATGSYQFNVVINKTTKTIFYFSVITLTAQTGHISISLPVPVKLDRGSTVTLSGTFTVGACVRSGSIVGFTYDPTIYNLGIND
jgi:hypothetical protein